MTEAADWIEELDEATQFDNAPRKQIEEVPTTEVSPDFHPTTMEELLHALRRESVPVEGFGVRKQ